MRIAQISPLYESVPPKLYGGTERIVSYLTEELVGLEHEVTLFASGDSITEARLVAATEQALREPGMRVGTRVQVFFGSSHGLDFGRAACASGVAELESFDRPPDVAEPCWIS